METIAEWAEDFNTLEKMVFKAMCKAACETMVEMLQRQDQIIKALRDKDEYILVDPSRERTIKTLMGEVSYKRGYYKAKSGGRVHLLDEALGITKDYGLYSEALAEQIIVECGDKSFRRAADTISELTGQSVSVMAAWGVLQKYGDKVQDQEKRLSELDAGGTTGQLGNIASKVLFQEMDDVWLSMQKKKRRKAGTPSAKGNKKSGKKPLHVGIAYTGWSERKDGRYATTDKIATTSFGGAKEFNGHFEMLLRHRYDMDGVDLRLMNGDGANWIKSSADESDAILQLDPYHRSQAILRGVSDRESRRKIYDAIREKDIDKTLAVTYSLVEGAEDDITREKAAELHGYFSENRESLLTWTERGIKLPAPPEGVVYRNMGVQESSNCGLITHRMKHRKGSWSEEGATNMGKILCYRHTIGFDEMLGPMPEPKAPKAETEPLSVGKVPFYEGKGYGGDWLYAGMPFDQAFRTNGREAIRGILKQKPL